MVRQEDEVGTDIILKSNEFCHETGIYIDSCYCDSCGHRHGCSGWENNEAGAFLCAV